jgi:hydrogenase maturation protein HypF
LQQEKPAVVRIDHVRRQPISLSEIGLETIAVATQTIRKTEIREAADGDDDWGSPILSEIADPDRPSSAYSHSTALRMQSARAQRHEKALENAMAEAAQGSPLDNHDRSPSVAIDGSEDAAPDLQPFDGSAEAEVPVLDSRLRGQRCPLHLRPEWRPAYRNLAFDGSLSETERVGSLMNLPSDRWSLPAEVPTLLGWLPDPIDLPPLVELPVVTPPAPALDLEPCVTPFTDSSPRLDFSQSAIALPEVPPTPPPPLADQDAQTATSALSDAAGMSGLDAPLALPAVPDSPSSIDDPSLLDSSLLPTTDQALSDALANELANLLDPLLEIDDGVTEETFLQGSMAPMEALRPPQLPTPPSIAAPHLPPPVRTWRSHPIDLSSGTILRPSFIPMKRDGRGTARSPADTIGPDLATCAACLRDLHDPRSRFYHDPFVSCSQCGPRLSVTRSLPYERARTTLAGFQHCTDCAADYANPESRRFQSQTASCPACGPFVWFEWVGQPNPAAKGDRAIEKVAQALLRGAIIAIKGLGGLHLVCDATQESVVQRLRLRKQSPDRPFPILVRHLAMAQRYCQMDDHERALLMGSAAPIVLLSRLPEAAIAPSVAPGLSELGVMLPDSPLHHLLMAAINRPLVFTSGNRSGEPPCLDNQEARSRLSSIADAFLLHNQSIVHRVDDSIVRVLPRSVQMIRRSRGYAPAAIRLPSGFERSVPILAMGGDRNNTLCLTQQGEAILSPHLGDLSTPTSLQAYRLALSQLRHLFSHRPGAIAVDLHPEGRSVAVGAELAATLEIPLLQIQRHHAQVAACLVDREWDVQQSPVLGIVLDDMGWGSDGSIWGGELLWTTYEQCHRVGSLQPVPLLGGERANREPWRNLYAQLQSAGLLAAADALATPDRDWFGGRHRPTLDSMLQTGFNSPLSSSCGRLIDAVAALLGLGGDHLSYPEHSAIALEALARSAPQEDTVAYSMDLRSDLLLRLHPAPLWQALLTDLAQGRSPALMALRFHRGLAQSFAQAARSLKQQGLLFSAIALGGTVLQNQLLLQCLETALAPLGCPVLVPQQVPVNDGSLALGQAAIATAWMNLSTDGTRRPHPTIQHPTIQHPTIQHPTIH